MNRWIIDRWFVDGWLAAVLAPAGFSYIQGRDSLFLNKAVIPHEQNSDAGESYEEKRTASIFSASTGIFG